MDASAFDAVQAAAGLLREYGAEDLADIDVLTDGATETRREAIAKVLGMSVKPGVVPPRLSENGPHMYGSAFKAWYFEHLCTKRQAPEVGKALGLYEFEVPEWLKPGSYVWDYSSGPSGRNRLVLDASQGLVYLEGGEEPEPIGFAVWHIKPADVSENAEGIPCPKCGATMNKRGCGPCFKERESRITSHLAEQIKAAQAKRAAA